MKQRILILFFLLSCGSFLRAQETPVKKPSYVFIADGQIITSQQLDAYAKNGDVKSMLKGVTRQDRDSLAQKLGDAIGEKEFVVIITLLSEKEKAGMANAKKTAGPDDGKSPANQSEAKNASPLVGGAAKNFRVSMSDGRNVQLSSLAGNVVMVNFWATWCGPCLMEFYDFPEKILKPFADKPFVLLPIARAESKETVLAKMQRLAKDGILFPVGWDTDNSIWAQLGDENAGIPRTILIDKKGIIRFVSVGNNEDNLATLVQEIAELMKE